MYSSIDKCFKIAQYALYKYGNKITEEQLENSITVITHSVDSRTIAKYKEMLLKPTAITTSQFRIANGFYIPTPNRPKTPNEAIAEAYKEKEQREGKSQ